MKTGIYRIVQVSTGRHYIGSAIHVDKRRIRHLWELRTGRHNNAKLQRSWNKYGIEDFTFEVMELCTPEVLIEREQYWIDSSAPYFNIMRKAGSALGYRHTDAAKAKNSAKMRAYLASLSPEERRAYVETRSAPKRGKKISEERRLAIVERMTGRSSTEKQKASFERNKQSPEAKAKRVAAKAWTWYVATDPDGAVHEFKNMRQFALERQLNQGHMVAMARGKRRIHKGWTCRYR